MWVLFSGETSEAKSVLKKILLRSNFGKRLSHPQFWNKRILGLLINVVIPNYKVKITVSGKCKKYYVKKRKAYTSRIRNRGLDDSFRAPMFFSLPFEWMIYAEEGGSGCRPMASCCHVGKGCGRWNTIKHFQ